MERKPQQQTLSIRISDTLRDFLERCKDVIANARGEPVSISDVAKILLESARDDRLDFRLEVAELLQTPTESLLNIRRKWEQRNPLARAEWIVLARYVQVACEGVTEDPMLPDHGMLTLVLEAFLAVHGMRMESRFGLDRYYLGNLGMSQGLSFNERQYDPDVVRQAVTRLVKELRECPSRPKPTFVARNLFVALRDEMLADMVALNTVLEPFLDSLFRLAVRGHWIRERRPVRARGTTHLYSLQIPPTVVDGLAVAISVSTEGELQLELLMASRSVSYTIASYPQIREFAALVDQLEVGRNWNGLHFQASADHQTPGGPSRLHFLRRTDGVRLTFDAEEWGVLKGLLSEVLALPRLQPILEELSLAYGEL